MSESRPYTGILNKVIKRDYSDGNTYFTLTMKDGRTIRCAGNMPDFRIGTPIRVTGTMTEKEYVKIDTVELADDDVQVMRMYFASPIFGKLSPRVAGKLALLVGDDIDGFLERETNVKELCRAARKKEEWAEDVLNKMRETRIQKQIMEEVYRAGGTVTDMDRIYGKFGEKAIEKMQKEPYSLILIKGITFEKCDRFARMYGISPDAPERIENILIQAMKNVQNRGDTCATFKDIVRSAEYIVKKSAFPDDRISRLEFLRAIAKSNSFHYYDGMFYLEALYQAEKSISHNIARILNTAKGYDISWEDVDEVEREMGFHSDPSQRKVMGALSHGGIAILTGPPGSGKTSTVLEFTTLARRCNRDIRIGYSATTGCAAQRLADSVGEDAQTVNKMLEPLPETGLKPSKNHYDPLIYDLIIVDESSMADTFLVCDLLDAIKDGSMLLIVGDVDQLKSVGPGKVMKDMIDSGVIPVYHLDTIHRQGQDSVIPYNAMIVNSGAGNLVPDNRSLFVYNVATEKDAEIVFDQLYDGWLKHLPVNQFCVLSMVKGSDIGVNNINKKIHDHLFGNQTGFKHGDYVFCVNERVMMVSNNYDEENTYFNGEMGKVIHFDLQSITIKLDSGKTIEIEGENLDDVVPAYAKTVHKAQGSEVPFSAFVLTDTMPYMLSRDILYTGLTRARSVMCIINVGNAAEMCIRNTYKRERVTGLKGMIVNAVQGSRTEKIAG